MQGPPERIGPVSEWLQGQGSSSTPKDGHSGGVSRSSEGWETWWRKGRAVTSPSMNAGPLSPGPPGLEWGLANL